MQYFPFVATPDWEHDYFVEGEEITRRAWRQTCADIVLAEQRPDVIELVYVELDGAVPAKEMR